MVRKKFNRLAVSGAEPAPDVALNDSTEAIQSASSEGRFKSWYWMLLMLTTCGVFGGMGIASLVSLLSLPPAADCQKLTSISPDMERLYCAQAAARSGQLDAVLSGLEMVATWTPEHPLYNEAQRSMEEWSASVLKVARKKATEADLQEAVNLANRIPKSSPTYKEAQAIIAEWREQRKQGQAIADQALAAMKQQNWDAASQHLAELTDLQSYYWRVQQSRTLNQRLVAEKQARRLLVQAENLAANGEPKSISTALTLTGQMSQDTFAWAEAQPKVNQWGETLLKVGFEHWQQGTLDEAIATAKQVFLNPNMAEEAQNLIHLSQARKLALSSVTPWQVLPQHTINLMEAIAAVRQIKTTSRFYKVAQESLKSWQAQLEDVQKLQIAQMTASLGQPQAMRLAIAQAQAISVNRPRRLQAQTLAAYWGQEIQRREDAPLLAHARQLASPATIPALRAAIAQATRIAPGRALGQEAQGAIAQWNGQIQTLEDQPILAEAQLLAQSGQLNDAIQTAGSILEGRSLYGEAQRAIRGWRAEIRRVQLARIRAEQEAARAAAAAAEKPLEEAPNTEPYQEPVYDQAPANDPTPYSPPQPVTEPAYINGNYEPIELAPAPPPQEAVPQEEVPVVVPPPVVQEPGAFDGEPIQAP